VSFGQQLPMVRRWQYLQLQRQVVQEDILIMKANEMHYFSNLFDKVLYMFRTCPLSIRSISTLYTRNRYLSFQFCWRLLAWSGPS